MSANAVTSDYGSCATGDGRLIQVHGLDSRHIGFAMAYVRARWDGDSAAQEAISAVVPSDEFLRSALELAVSLAVATTLGTSRIVDPIEAQVAELAMARSWVLDTVASYEEAGDRASAQFGRDLDRILSIDSLNDSPVIHDIEWEQALGVCATLMNMTLTRRGVAIQSQFEALEQLIVFRESL